METVMHKHMANLTTFHPKTNSPSRSWYSALRTWREARQLHKAERKRAEIVSELTPQILYDIGEIDCRPLRSTSPIWDDNPYRLLIEAMMSRNPSEFDPRR
jgi:hypothetical protein